MWAGAELVFDPGRADRDIVDTPETIVTLVRSAGLMSIGSDRSLELHLPDRAFRARPLAASFWNFFLPYFLRPMAAATAPGSETLPFAAIFFLRAANRLPEPSFGFLAAAITEPPLSCDRRPS